MGYGNAFEMAFGKKEKKVTGAAGLKKLGSGERNG
jgi:hypothetical protein